MNPNLDLFLEHIAEAPFQIGLDNGKWGLENEISPASTWPVVIIWVQAAEKLNSPDRFYFRFELTGYPNPGPTAMPWDIDGKRKLPSDQWPKGGTLITSIFNSCNAYLYAPCDRLAQPGHEGWKTEFPQWWWYPTSKLVTYLEFLHHHLNCSDYAS